MASNTFDPPTGEQPLPDSSMPQYNGSQGSTVAAQYHVFQDFKAQFGRNPTQSELNLLTPNYLTGDPNKTNNAGGLASVSAYYQQLANTPANVYSRQQSQWQAAAPQQYDAVQQLFQSTYGRAATQDELSHYGTLLASGQADPYQVQQFLMSTPEYQNTQDAQFRSGVDTTLQKSDENFFNRTKGDITQQYALMGRATSPALDVALTDLASQLSDKRQTFLAQLSASQYGSNKSAALGNYQSTEGDVTSRINANTQGIYGNYQSLLNNAKNQSDYLTQNMNWQDAMNQYGSKGPSALDYLNTGLNAAKTATQIHAPA